MLTCTAYYIVSDNYHPYRENRLESTEKLIEGLEKELKSPGTAPLSSSYETDLQTSVNNDSETNSN